MAQEHSFDVVCKIDLQEVRNALAQATKEVGQRFDFKGSKSAVTLDEKVPKLELVAEDDMKLRNLADILKTKLVKRQVPLKAFEFQPPVATGGSLLRQQVPIQQGIPSEKAKEIVKLIKGTKLKVQSAIQGDQLRVSGKNLDDLQQVIQLLKTSELDVELQCINYR